MELAAGIISETLEIWAVIPDTNADALKFCYAFKKQGMHISENTVQLRFRKTQRENRTHSKNSSDAEIKTSLLFLGPGGGICQMGTSDLTAVALHPRPWGKL
jgi:hypothetical protein